MICRLPSQMLIVMTDWWAEINNAPKDKPSHEKFAAMVLAQNDLYMVTSDTTQVMGDLEAALASGRLERRHLTRCAENICRSRAGTEHYTSHEV